MVDGAVISYCMENVLISKFRQSVSGGEGYQELSLKYEQMTYAFPLGETDVVSVNVEEGTARFGGSC